MDSTNFIEPLEKYLLQIPAVRAVFGGGQFEDGNWWVKFAIDTDHYLSWQAVQELGHVLNYVSVSERLPTVFMPVSPPPYLNGGPEDFLCWVIEAKDTSFTPVHCVEWLEGRLPRPVDDLDQWDQNE